MSQAAHIKVREIGTKRWVFLARNGVNNLRVHALRFETVEKAQALIHAYPVFTHDHHI